MSAGRGSGFAAATTQSSWSAFATTTRSTSSVSSALRRSTVSRGRIRTIRASEPVVAGQVAEHVDAVADDDALLAELAGAGGEHRALVRTVLVDEHLHAAAVDGEHAAGHRRLVRGALLRARPRALAVRPDPGVGLVVVLVRLVLLRHPAHGSIRVHRLDELRQRLRGRRDVLDGEARRREAEQRARRRDAVVRVAAPRPVAGDRAAAVHDEAVLGLLGGDPDRAELGRERREPVGLVTAEVPDAGERRGPVRERGEADERRVRARRPRRGRGRRAAAGARRRPAPATVSAPPRSSTSAPNAASHSRRRSPTCVVSSGQPGTLTRPPATSAAARNGAAFDRSGSIARSRPAMRCAGTRPPRGRPSGSVVSACTPRRRERVDRHVDVGEGGEARAAVLDLEAVVEPRAGEQQPGHELAGLRGVDEHRPAVDAAGAADGERHGAAALVVDLDAERPERQDRGRHRAQAGALVAVEPDGPVRERGDGRQEAHQRAGEADVDRDAAGERCRA